MTSDRLHRVEALYHEMLGLPVPERAVALAAACPDDPALAAEVQSLLDQPDSAAGFLGRPALEVAAGQVSATRSTVTGRRLGVFEVQELLGLGGMGEVYRARDTKLGRTVAIKVLPEAFASDPDRLARFNREARVLASLNHPNIGTLYGVEEADGAIALVLEFVEGETLSRRIAGKGLPASQALAMAKQIADALDAAHEKGVVHRDLKPANIMITPIGVVKVLDFGLAKLGLSETAAALSHSPTATSGGTREGVVVGTAAYMSPEQARGLPVDKRTDIWAFGCVLFEMLTGQPAFGRATTSDTIAAIIERQVDWALLPKGTPASVARLLRRCLDKDPRHRLRDIADARAELEDLEPATARAEGESKARAVEGPSRAAFLGGALTLVALGALGFWALRSKPVTPPESRLALPLGAGLQFTGITAYVAVAPDGRTVSFSATSGTGVGQQSVGGGELYLRPLDKMTATPLSQRGSAQFFSPDGLWLAFFDDNKLKKIPVSGGPPSSWRPRRGAKAIGTLTASSSSAMLEIGRAMGSAVLRRPADRQKMSRLSIARRVTTTTCLLRSCPGEGPCCTQFDRMGPSTSWP